MRRTAPCGDYIDVQKLDSSVQTAGTREASFLVTVKEYDRPNTRRIFLSKETASELAHAFGEPVAQLAEAQKEIQEGDERILELNKRLWDKVQEVERYCKRIKALEARIAKAIDTLVTNP